MGRARASAAALLVGGLLLGSLASPPEASAMSSAKLAVVIVHVGTTSSPDDVEALRQTAFGATDSVASRFAQIGIRVTGKILGPVSISASTARSCDIGRYESATYRALSAAGISVRGYRFVILRLFRPAGSCSFYDQGYLFDQVSVVNSTSADAWVHEMGHNLGFDHANGLACSGRRDYRAIPMTRVGCREYEYQDHYSVMGASSIFNGVGGGDAVPFDAWRAYGIARSVVGPPATIPTRYRSVRLAFLDDRRGLARHWATMPLAKGWRLSIEIVRGRSGEACDYETASPAGDTPTTWWARVACGPALALRLLPPGGPFGIYKFSALVRSIGLGSAFHDARRNWSVRFASLVDGIATVTIGDTTPTAPPTNVVASLASGTDGTHVQVGWTPSVTAERGITYEVATMSGWTPQYVIVGSASGSSWTSPEPSMSAPDYFVRAVDMGGNASEWVAAGSPGG